MVVKTSNREFLARRLGTMEQLAGIRRLLCDDGLGRGMRLLEVNNGNGLVFTVLPDRGMDIGAASYRGLPLAWMAPNGLVAPQYYDSTGNEWLRTWPGGLLTGCGLANVGGPDCVAGESHGLHGRLSHLAAEEVNCSARWRNQHHYELRVSGKVRHTKVFGEKLIMTRSIITALGEDGIIISDTIENQGFKPVPLMLLYHINLGWPLVSPESVLSAAEHPITPATKHAAHALDAWPNFAAPTPGFDEQVYFHELPADDQGLATISLHNPALELTLTITYRTAELPYLIQWKMPGEGEYVLGLEPANCLPTGQTQNREGGTLRMIEPGAKITTQVKLSLA